MIAPELLPLLRCPETLQPLAYQSADPVRGLPEGFLREDGQRLYPIREGIPLLLVDAAIAVSPSRELPSAHDPV